MNLNLQFFLDLSYKTLNFYSFFKKKNLSFAINCNPFCVTLNTVIDEKKRLSDLLIYTVRLT